METHWNIQVSEEVNRQLRAYLAEEGLKRGALSRFVEEAVSEGFEGTILGRMALDF